MGEVFRRLKTRWMVEQIHRRLMVQEMVRRDWRRLCERGGIGLCM